MKYRKLDGCPWHWVGRADDLAKMIVLWKPDQYSVALSKLYEAAGALATYPPETHVVLEFCYPGTKRFRRSPSTTQQEP